MKNRWLQVLISGLLLFIGLDAALRITGYPTLIPAVTILGSFLVPVTMTVFFYGHIRDRDISPPLLSTAFVIGGALGVTAAAILEFNTLRTLDIFTLAGVAVIEESAKLIFPLAMFAVGKYRHEADGLLFGVAAGMGFAALETISYGMGALVDTGGSVSALEQVLLLRGLLSPAGHAAWTGLACSVLWRERERVGRAAYNSSVILTFLLVIILHFAWNLFSLWDTSPLLSSVGFFSVAALSLGLLLARYREARRNLPEQLIAPQAGSPSAG